MSETDNQQQIKEKIFLLLKEYFNAEGQRPFVPGENRIQLMEPHYGSVEVVQVLESLLSRQLTLNQNISNKVGKFEKSWADYIGTRHGVMVNSGSSANLLALSLLASPIVPEKRRLIPGDEVITPAVTWTTTVSPIYQVGARPVFVDVNQNDYTINTEQLEEAISERTKAILLVHLLGNPCNLDKVKEIASRRELTLVEDCCEAHGAEWKNKRVGSVGDLSTFSFFFSHHITTIEGGMVMTNNDDWAEQLRAMRSQGVVRNLHNLNKYLKALYQIDNSYRELDTRFLFVALGFNLRPSEIHGSFGIEQVKKIDQVIERRQEIGRYYAKNLGRYEKWFTCLREERGRRHVYFGFPLLVSPKAPFTRNDMSRWLEQHNIETRPIMTGLVTRQPVFRHYPYRHVGKLPVAHLVHDQGLFLGVHTGISREQQDYVINCIDEFVKKYS